jgi:hypothetical protein
MRTPVVITVILLALAILILITYIQRSLYRHYQFEDNNNNTNEDETIYSTNNDEELITSHSNPKTGNNNHPDAQNIEQLIHLLQDKTFIVVQTDTRLRKFLSSTSEQQQQQQPNNPIPLLFSKQIPLVSVLSMFTWATITTTSQLYGSSHNYGYLFLDIDPEHCALPGLTNEENIQKLAYYWCKVPAMKFMNSLLLHMNTILPSHKQRQRYILFVDTDTFPGGAANETLETIVAKNPGSWHMLVNSDRGYYWWGVALHVYLRIGGINSGVILFRVSPRTDELISTWWFDLTRKSSPYELANSVFRIKIPTQYRGKAAVDGYVKNLFSQLTIPSHIAVNFSWSDYYEDSNTVNIHPHTSVMKDFYTVMNLTCTTNNKAGTADAADAAVTCVPPAGKAEILNTLLSWPGDQDRLNWLADLHAGKDIRLETTGVLGGGCLKGTKLVGHWCKSLTTKEEGAKQASEILKNIFSNKNNNRNSSASSSSSWETMDAYQILSSHIPWARLGRINLMTLQQQYQHGNNNNFLDGFRIMEFSTGKKIDVHL